MRFTKTPIAGVYEVEIEPHRDERGFFARAWCSWEFEQHGLASRLVQTNLVGTRLRGTVRGLHYQIPPHAEAKCVRCTRGAIFDVAVDIRRSSPTYGCWHGVRLDPRGARMLYVPPGCAHGYQALEDDSETFYFSSQFYTPGAERGLRWNDRELAIAWPITAEARTSEKDGAWPDFTAIGAEELPE